LFDSIVAWGGIDAVRERSEALFTAGADQLVLNLVTGDPTVPYVSELRQLSILTS
jgi:hypothetical protein